MYCLYIIYILKSFDVICNEANEFITNDCAIDINVRINPLNPNFPGFKAP